MIYTVTLNPSIDMIMSTSGLKAGGVNRAQEVTYLAGGKGINVSRVLSAMGLGSIATGFLGGFTGEQFIKLLEADFDDKMKRDFVISASPDDFTRINVKVIDESTAKGTPGGTETEINGSGYEISEEDKMKLLDKLSGISSKDTLIVSGSCPKNCEDMYSRLAELANKRGAYSVFDIPGKYIPDILEYEPDLLKPNEEELMEAVAYQNAYMFGVGDMIENMARAERDDLIEKLHAENDEEKKLEQLQSAVSELAGAGSFLISRGGDGAVLFSNENGEIKVYRQPAFDGEVVHTLGAGDSMVAGFIAGREMYGDSEIKEVLTLSCAAGSACAFRIGLPDMCDIQDLLNDSEI